MEKRDNLIQQSDLVPHTTFIHCRVTRNTSNNSNKPLIFTIITITITILPEDEVETEEKLIPG
ncbi:hypothetical protein E2C01_068832 [Portunus trituberculatus]|uniref:Uncharacterized protein n=1 Tax=Portunus trituberculatus TaxID=210409 RepID=A0A5B7HWZ8_PORTR|nr:hypothetical protein [Portunus trituberculatus]